jgi:aspartyl aminopeptidase
MSETQRNPLFYAPKNGYDRMSEADRTEMERYCRDYMKFMDAAKTEREAVTESIRIAEGAGFRAYVPGMALKAGDRVYYNNRGKAIIFAVIGSKDLSNGANIAAAHVDSPRLDLKPNPLYEDSEFALLKTHYYGGIKKYQWTTVPMALHGVVVLSDGTSVNVNIGEDDSDPILYITDLLIHLSGDQMKKSLAEGVTAEQLNAIIGSIPDGSEDAERIKLAVLKLLNEKYGMTEVDFISSELTLVPALKAREVGLDRSLIAAYGHDDRVCAYAEFEPLLTMGVPEKTAVCILADKEEIGSEGVSGMQSEAFETFMSDLCDTQGVALKRCFENSVCMSADVTAGFDPTWPEVSERRNNAKLNYGIALCKYTGSRGKSGASDASAELVGRVRRFLDKGEVMWQMCEMGKVDQGGGGTVACYMAKRNIDTLDAGVPVLSMHAPYELVSKLDCYMTMKAMRTFYEVN